MGYDIDDYLNNEDNSNFFEIFFGISKCDGEGIDITTPDGDWRLEVPRQLILPHTNNIINSEQGR